MPETQRMTLFRLCLITGIFVTVVFSVFVSYQRAAVLSYLLTESTGHAVLVGSINNIDLGRTLKIDAFNIQTQQPEFEFHASQLNITIGFFERAPFIEEVLARNAKLILTPSAKAQNSRENFSLPSLPKNYILENVYVRYIDEDQDWQTLLSQCSGSRIQLETFVKVDCKGYLEDKPLNVSGRYGLVDKKGAAEPLDISVNWGSFTLKAEGYLDSLLTLRGADFNITARAPSNKPVLQLLGIHEVVDAPLDLTLTLTDTNPLFDINAQLNMGELSVTLDGSARSLSPDRMDLDFDLSGHSLYEFGALFNEFRLQPEPFAATGRVDIRSAGVDISALTLRSGSNGLLKGNILLPHYPSLADVQAHIEAFDVRPTLITSLAEYCDALNEPMNFNARITDSNQISQRIIATLESRDLTASIEGWLAPEKSASDLHVNISRASLGPLGQCVLTQLPDVVAAATFDLVTDRHTANIKNLDFKFDHAQTTGQVIINYGAIQPEMNLDLVLQTKDIGRLANVVGLIDSVFHHIPAEIHFLGQVKGGKLSIESLSAGHLSNTLQLSGELSRGERPWYNLKVLASGDNLRDVLNDEESNSQHPQPFNLVASIAGSDQFARIDEFDLNIVKSRLTIEGNVAFTNKFVGSQIEMRAQGKNLESLMGHLVPYPVPPLPFNLSATIDLDEEFIKVTGLDGIIGEHELTATLTVDKPPNYQRTKGEVKIKGPSTTELAQLTTLSLDMLNQPYAAEFVLGGTKENILLSTINIDIGESDVTGGATIQLGKVPKIRANLRSKEFYLPLIAPGLVSDEINMKEAPESDTLFSKDPLSVEWLSAANIDLEWHLERVWVSETYDTRIDIDLSIKDGVLETNKVHWYNNFSQGDIHAQVKATDSGLSIIANTKSSRFPILWLLAGSVSPASNTQFNASLKSEGESIAALMSGLNGQMLFKDGAGHIKANKLNELFGDFFHNISSKITERKKDLQTKVTCSAGGISIVDGVASFKPGIVARTDRVDWFTTGELNLTTEKPNLAIMTRPRTGLGISPVKILAPKLKVVGTLAKPAFSIDATSSALSAGAAFFSGGVSIIASAIWDRLNSNNEACDLLYEQALKLPEFSRYGKGVTAPKVP
ncbi:MAG: hypothetical protein ACI8Z1_000445 [Candidatus Azotimanducaceae bacterium]|jgi:hypothetical protein